MKAVAEEVRGCCSTGAESKTCKLFFGRNSFRINASYDSETRAWKMLWKELEAVALLELNRKRVNFFFGRNSFSNNANYDKESSELKNVVLLELGLKHVNFSLLGEIHLVVMLITIENPDIIIVVLEAVALLEQNQEHEKSSGVDWRLLFNWN
uniref:Uncharacterized protein n=1 Tax=Strongyloides stercoralis TaxID=6248 RepID=A0AAF5DFG9_STRER